MKKAVIQAGGRQYIVAEGDVIKVNLQNTDKKTIDFDVIMIVDGKSTVVGSPTVKDVKVVTSVAEADVQADKVTSIRYKSKKRVHKVRGHRQRETVLEIKSIS